MSSAAIILPIIYDRQMRRNRRELFIKRFTSCCVVIATLFIVVGLSSATWYMTILGTFILMIVGLSGFCLKYCDRSNDRRAMRRAISISSRISSSTRRSTRHAVPTVSRNGAADESDLPPAYDNIVFDEPYSLSTTSYQIRTYDQHISPPPPYEEICNVNQTTESTISIDVPAPAYSATCIDSQPVSRTVPTTLVVPQFSLNQHNRQSVCLSHAIGVTITSRTSVNNGNVSMVTPVAHADAFNDLEAVAINETNSSDSSNATDNVTSQGKIEQVHRVPEPTPETTDDVQSEEPELPQTVVGNIQIQEHCAQENSVHSSNEAIDCVDVTMDIVIVNENTESSTSDSDCELTHDSNSSESSTS